MDPNNPQAREMGDESMVRNLAAQAKAIWPQERPLFERYRLPPKPSILDVGCGTAEITARIAELYPTAEIVGVDLDEGHLARARERCKPFGSRVKFQRGDALALEMRNGQFDLVVCRHLLQAVPDARLAMKEMRRVARSGGFLHVIAEDYGMLWCHPTEWDSDVFWHKGALVFGDAVGTDNRIGRKLFTILTDLGLTDIAVDYLVVDTLRVPRETFAQIWEAWRDGYTDSLVKHTELPRAELDARWADMIGCVRNPRGYALWQVPLWSARIPR